MKKKFHPKAALLIALVLCLFSSCKKNDWQEHPPSKGQLDGYWKSEGYGYVLEIKNGKAVAYHHTADFGIRKTPLFDNASEDVRTWDVRFEGAKQFVYRSRDLITHFRFHRLNKLPQSLQNGGLPFSTDPLLNFDVLWQTFDEQYAFFRKRGVDWKAVREQYRPRVNEGNLEALFKEILTKFNEDHVTLTTTTDDFLNRFDAGINRTLSHFAADLPAGTPQTDLKLYALGEYEKIIGNILANYVSDFKVALDNQLIWGGLDEKTGYLLVGQMAGYELGDLKNALDETLQDLNQFDQLVIDLRANLGGSDRVVLELAGRFVNKATVGWQFAARDGNGLTPRQTVTIQPTGTVRFTKPIRILTSIATSSAAEVFTLVMKQQPYVRTVGETTNGIFSSLLTKQLPNGWVFSLSNEVLTDAQGKEYEAQGVKSDIAAPFPEASHRNKGVDPALDVYQTWF